MSRIFISYKRVDKDKVFKIKDRIENALGEKCWIDLDGIESDAQFANVIINAINNCKVFLFMYSAAHSRIIDYKNDWTVRELDFAQHKGKRIVFVNIDASQLTDWFYMLFGTMQQVDATNQEQLSKLIQDIKGWLGCTELAHKEVDRPIRPESNNSGISFSINALRKNKGCSIALSVAFVLCIVMLPLGYINYIEKQDSDVVAINTQGQQDEDLAPETSCPPELTRPPYNDGQTTAKPSVSKIAFVDLGLPSKTMWADRNVGANKESDYGNLYSWGETSTKKDYRQSCYTNIDTNNIVGSKYDVATQVCGHRYQMPTQTQFDELIKECRWEWKDNGYKVIGKNGKYIFLPATGWSCSSAIEYRNVYGYYWTSDRYNSDFAKGLLFSKSEKKTGNGYLYYGRAVRPVRR